MSKYLDERKKVIQFPQKVYKVCKKKFHQKCSNYFFWWCLLFDYSIKGHIFLMNIVIDKKYHFFLDYKRKIYVFHLFVLFTSSNCDALEESMTSITNTNTIELYLQQHNYIFFAAKQNSCKNIYDILLFVLGRGKKTLFHPHFVDRRLTPPLIHVGGFYNNIIKLK